MKKNLSKDKELQIINAATKLLFSKGPYNTTIEDIAKEADLGKGTVYLYFKSKEEIFFVVIKKETLALLQKIKWAIELETTAVGKLRQFLITKFKHFETIVKTFQTSLEVIRETRQQPQVQQIAEEQINEEIKILSSIIQFGITKGEFDSNITHVDIISLAISLSTRGDMPWELYGKRIDAETKVHFLLDLFVNGLKAKEQKA